MMSVPTTPLAKIDQAGHESAQRRNGRSRQRLTCNRALFASFRHHAADTGDRAEHVDQRCQIIRAHVRTSGRRQAGSKGWIGMPHFHAVAHHKAVAATGRPIAPASIKARRLMARS